MADAPDNPLARTRGTLPGSPSSSPAMWTTSTVRSAPWSSRLTTRLDGPNLPHRRRGQVTWRELAVRLYTGSPRRYLLKVRPVTEAAKLHASPSGAARRRHLRRLAHPGRGWLLQRRAHLPLAGAREPHRRGGGLPLGRPRHRHHLRPTHGRRSGSAPRAPYRGHAHRGPGAFHRSTAARIPTSA